MLSFKSPLINLQSTVWNYGLMVPTEIARQFLPLNDKRVICHLNGQLKIHVALMPKGDDTWFINVNKETRKKLKIEEGNELFVEIETDTTEYGMEAPEEFLELLQQDHEGNELFKQLTKGKQRALLQIVLTVKSSQKRIERSITIVEYLKDVNGKLDFRALHEALKNPRF